MLSLSTAFVVALSLLTDFDPIMGKNIAKSDIEDRTAPICTPTRYAPRKWRYVTEPTLAYQEPYITNGCAKDDEGRYWTMLPAYRSRSPGLYWKYTDDIDDSECLEFWNYYDKSGNKLLGRILRTTKLGDLFSFRWCPLAVSQKLGKEGQVWVYCNCTTPTRS